MKLGSRKNQRKISAVIILLVIVGMLVTALASALSAYGKTVLVGSEPGTICAGVTVEGIDISGMTVDEAKEKVDAYVDALAATVVSVKIGEDATEEKTLEALGFGADADAFIDDVAKIGKTGNLIQRYKDLKDAAEGGNEHNMDFTVDQEVVAAWIGELAETYNVEAKSATMTRSGGQWQITRGNYGTELNVEESTAQLMKALTEDWEIPSADDLESGLHSPDISVEFAMEETEPEYTSEDLQNCQTLLGTYSTNYGTGNRGRAQNVENGCRLINGSMLMPGEVLSADAKMRPYTIENGYGVGGAYVNGKVQDDIGGGICQVSTTLYNAVLFAELGVVQRANHSMTVDYVPLARDAAIAGDWKDFKFENTSDYPIYVEGYAGGGTITFNIYGYESRPSNRSISFDTEVLETIQPGADIITEDPTKTKDYRVVTQGSWTGYRTVLYKTVKVDGVQTERYQVNTSNYVANPRYVTVGTKDGKDEEEDPEEKDEEKTTEEKKEEQKPAEEKPTEQKPAEQKPAEEKPAEQKPVEEKPVEEQPADTGTTDPGTGSGEEQTSGDGGSTETPQAGDGGSTETPQDGGSSGTGDAGSGDSGVAEPAPSEGGDSTGTDSGSSESPSTDSGDTGVIDLNDDGVIDEDEGT